MADNLQQELGKKRPFESPEQEAALNLVRTQDHLSHEFDRLFGEHGISAPQYNVLRILRGMGGDGVCCQEVAGKMVTRMPDITRLVDRLEQAGLVRRARTAQDRRMVLVQITDAGKKLLAGLDKPVVELHRSLLGHLSATELKELNRLLVKARQPQPRRLKDKKP
jgi:DNA-binding MarR family transcriptional regulator